jgi:hypothetical protein
MSDYRTHELRIYANSHHKHAKFGELLLHLWFRSEHSMQMDLDIALNRRDVAYVDLIDCEKFTTERKYPSVSRPHCLPPETT